MVSFESGVADSARSRSDHLQIRRDQVERQRRPALAHSQKRDPGRPVFGQKAEHRERLDAVTALALDRESDAPDRPADAPIRPHPFLRGFSEAFSQDAPRNRKERIEIERHAVRIHLRADALLFMPPPEDIPQFAGEVLGRFARRRPSPHHAEVNLLINAVPLRPPIDEARPRGSADKIVEPLVRPRDLKPVPDKFRPLGNPDSIPRSRKFGDGLARQYAPARRVRLEAESG